MSKHLTSLLAASCHPSISIGQLSFLIIDLLLRNNGEALTDGEMLGPGKGKLEYEFGRLWRQGNKDWFLPFENVFDSELLMLCASDALYYTLP
jgi:hypothetical protein